MTRARLASLALLGAVAAVVAPVPAARAAGAWNGEVKVSTATAASLSPHLAAYGGILHAAWCTFSSGNWEVLYSRSADDGATWIAPRNISNNARTDCFPYVAADASGVYVLWNSDGST